MSALTLLPGAELLAAAARPELPQKDDLCGPFWALAAVRALAGPGRGYGDDGAPAEAAGEGGGQDVAALAAGTRLWTGGGGLSPGRPPRRDYTLELPVTADPELAGTDTGGVLRAIARLGGGRVVATRILDPAGAWRERDLAAFTAAVVAGEHPVAVLLNVSTGEYRFPARPEATDRYLASGDTSEYLPSEWSVGHFAALLGWRDGRGGRLYRVHDSYPLAAVPAAGDIGERAIHEQPAAALSAALRRPGRTPGSLIVAAASDPALSGVVAAAERVGWRTQRAGG